MIEHDLPIAPELTEHEREFARCRSAAFRRAGESETAEDPRAPRASGVDFEIGKRERAHRGGRGIALAIAGQRGLPTARDLRADEGEFGRIPICGHEGGDVRAVPGILLRPEQRANGGGRIRHRVEDTRCR